jgi:hypothetical protein
MKHFFICLNRSQRPPLLHPCENIPFPSKQAAENFVKQLQEDPTNQFVIFEYEIREVEGQANDDLASQTDLST